MKTSPKKDENWKLSFEMRQFAKMLITHTDERLNIDPKLRPRSFTCQLEIIPGVSRKNSRSYMYILSIPLLLSHPVFVPYFRIRWLKSPKIMNELHCRRSYLIMLCLVSRIHFADKLNSLNSLNWNLLWIHVTYVDTLNNESHINDDTAIIPSKCADNGMYVEHFNEKYWINAVFFIAVTICKIEKIFTNGDSNLIKNGVTLVNRKKDLKEEYQRSDRMKEEENNSHILTHIWNNCISNFAV